MSRLPTISLTFTAPNKFQGFGFPEEEKKSFRLRMAQIFNYRCCYKNHDRSLIIRPPLWGNDIKKGMMSAPPGVQGSCSNWVKCLKWNTVSMYSKYGSDMRPVWKSLEVPDRQMFRNIGITVHSGQCAAPSQVTLIICVHISLDVVYLHTKFEKQMLQNCTTH